MEARYQVPQAALNPMNFVVCNFNRIGSANPILGILATSICTVAAIGLLPRSIAGEGALRSSCVVMAIGLAFPVVSSCVQNIRSLLHPTNILGLAPIFWLLLEPIQGKWDPGPCGKIEVSIVIWAIGCFAVCAWIGSTIGSAGVSQRLLSKELELTPNTLFRLGVFAFLVAFLRFAIPCGFNPVVMVQGLGAGRWDAPWSRGSTGGFDSFIDHFSYFGFLISPLAARLIVLTSWRDRRFVILGFLGLVIAIFLAQNGGRRIIGVFALSFFFVLNISSDKLRIKNFLLAGLAVVALMWVSQTMLQYRNLGLSAIWADKSKVDVPNKYDYFHVDSNFRSCAEIAYYVPSKHPFVTYQYLVWVAVRPVPRILWPGKPLDMGFDLAAASNQKGVSLSSTIIGESYTSGGLIGVGIAGILFGWLSSLASTVLKRARTTGDILVGAVITLAIFAGMRSGADLVLMSYPILAWWVAVRFFGSAK